MNEIDEKSSPEQAKAPFDLECLEMQLDLAADGDPADEHAFDDLKTEKTLNELPKNILKQEQSIDGNHLGTDMDNKVNEFDVEAVSASKTEIDDGDTKATRLSELPDNTSNSKSEGDTAQQHSQETKDTRVGSEIGVPLASAGEILAAELPGGTSMTVAEDRVVFSTDTEIKEGIGNKWNDYKTYEAIQQGQAVSDKMAQTLSPENIISGSKVDDVIALMQLGLDKLHSKDVENDSLTSGEQQYLGIPKAPYVDYGEHND